MSTVYKRQGGIEAHAALPDVTVAGSIITPAVAYSASRTALRYFNSAQAYSYVSEVDDYDEIGGIVRVGIWSPEDYNPKNTIIGNPHEVARSKSFVNAARALCFFAGTTTEKVKYIKVMSVHSRCLLPMHKDYYVGSRYFLQLKGIKIVEFEQEYDNILVNSNVILGPGDSYGMQFRDNESSISHSVEYVGTTEDDLSVALYIDVRD